MQIVMEVKGEALKADLQGIFDSLTVEDKRAKFSYSQEVPVAMEYAKEILTAAQGKIAETIEQDETLKAKLAEILDAIKPQLGDYILRAVQALVAQGVASHFQTLANLEGNNFQLTESLKRLGQRG